MIDVVIGLSYTVLDGSTFLGRMTIIAAEKSFELLLHKKLAELAELLVGRQSIRAHQPTKLR